MPPNRGIREDSQESPGLQGDPISLSQRKSILNIHWKDWCWSSNNLATWCNEPTHGKRPWCWERLKAREGYGRGRDGWMASPTQWTWVWVSSGRWWRTQNPGVLGVHGVAKSWTWLSNRTTTTLNIEIVVTEWIIFEVKHALNCSLSCDGSILFILLFIKPLFVQLSLPLLDLHLEQVII